MRRLAAAFGWVGLMAAGASADPTHAGVQDVPPVTITEPVLAQQLDGRRAVRGCPVGDSDCTSAHDILREFEAERIPPPSGSPWITERTPPGSALEPGPVKLVKKPSELRPDAPWLDQLALPDLPVRWSQRLVDYLVFYRDDPRGRAIMSGWLRDQGRYKDLIVSHLRKARLPEDLLYVAMIESSYDPDTLSRAGALGLWQWMPAGAKIYGLRRDRWVDERRDPYRSTIAQMDYFRDLYQRFGDWHTALAAFNVGYGAMLKSIARYNTNDYYQLCAYENALPWENCWYTPKVLAAAIVGKNRAAFRMDGIKPAPAEVWDEIAVPTSIHLGILARAAGTTEAELKKLNPHLRQGRTPPNEPGYLVRVPAGRKADAQRRLAELQTEWDGYDAYVVSHGERFEDIATTFGTTTWALKKLNGVTHESEVEGGSVLVVPRISEDARAKNRAKARAKLHTSGVDQKDGEPLIVAVPDKDATVPGKKRVFYRVVVGDSVKSVAKAFGVRSDDLRRWSGLDPDGKLHPKMVLQLWVAPDFDPDAKRVTLLDEAQLAIVTRGSPEHLDLAEARTGRVRMEYVAKGKEKLEAIAKRFGMGKHDLARINRISYNTVLEKGDKIIVYQVADPSRSERASEQWRKTPRVYRGKLAGPRAVDTASAKQDVDADADDDEGNERTDERPTPKADKPEPKASPKSKRDDSKATREPEKRDEPDTNAGKASRGGGPVTKPTQVD